jgi:ABC-type multidrug transport system fused ATPase/permease subunit
VTETHAKHLRRVRGYLAPYKGLVVSIAVIVVVGSLLGLLVPWPLQFLVDYVLGQKPLPHALDRFFGGHSRFALLLVAVGAGLVLTLIENVLGIISNYVTTRLDQHMVLDFRADLLQHAQRLSLGFHDQKSSGPLVYAINFQSNAAAGIVLALPPLAQSVITLVGMFTIVCVIDWKLALLSLCVVPFLYWSIGLYAKHIQHRLRHVKEMEEASLSIIHEAIRMLRVIMAFGREGYEHQRFRRQGEATVNARINLTVRQTMFSLAVNTITAIGIALVLGFGAYKVLQGAMTVGQLLVVMTYIAAVYKPLEAISYTLGSLQDNVVNLEMASSLLDEQPEIQDSPLATDLARTAGRITFEHVSFSYLNRSDTLCDIDFSVEPGEVVAVVGPTGAGKTTLISLIPRFYEPNRGRVCIDGRDVRDVTLRSLRAQISIVLQEPMLFSGTVADNIRYGRLDASMDDIIAAAKASNAHEFIMRLPQQYETTTGERGVQLSGGERQRICVARAFLKDAPILILDEPTSAIDSRTESLILDALDRLMCGRTTFVIAHRLSTVRKADKILVLDHGRLVEQGTHPQLIERRGLYRQLHEIQTAASQRGGKLASGAEEGSGFGVQGSVARLSLNPEP